MGFLLIAICDLYSRFEILRSVNSVRCKGSALQFKLLSLHVGSSISEKRHRCNERSLIYMRKLALVNMIYSFNVSSDA